MRCPPGAPTFRLLDSLVGWDEASPDGLIGLEDGKGLRLAVAGGGTEGLRREALLPYFSPKQLARGCGPCDWYLVTPVPPEPRLLHRGRCTGGWSPVWPRWCDPSVLVRPVAVAARGHVVAVADPGAGSVLVWAMDGAKLLAEIRLESPSVVALLPWSEVLVVQSGATELLRYGLSGTWLGPVATGVEGEIEAVASGGDCSIWLLVRGSDGRLEVWEGARDRQDFHPGDPDRLAEAVSRTSLVAASEAGFCLAEEDPGGAPVTSCFSWFARSVPPESIRASLPPERVRYGQLLTEPIDSGIPRCRWHRVRIDASVPPGTGIDVAVSTSETPNPPAQGDQGAEPAPWSSFPAGVPHPQDWQAAPSGAEDFLLNGQPPGRYLFVRIRLSGDERATPSVRRVRLDFPRATSFDMVPAVYHQDPRADDFGERFLSLFDAAVEEVDRSIERSAALLDPEGMPDEALPWLGGLLGVTFETSWDPAVRRRVLAAVPGLYRLRGTPAGIRRAVETVFGATGVLIEEMAWSRSWAGLGRQSHLGRTRLFGRSASRFRLGTSSLSRTRIKSFGNPDDDPLTAQAYRVRVLVPPPPSAPLDVEEVSRVVISQSPAHVVADVRIGGAGFVVGAQAGVGVDTALGSVPPSVLGPPTGTKPGTVRLGRRSVLWHGRSGRAPGMRLGDRSVLGTNTVSE